jgi:transcriptional regulator with GAF, ATPase, and Fis domain
VIVVFSGSAPAAWVIACGSSAVEIGRSDAGPGKLDDGRVSRRHARIAFEGGRCIVTDLSSQNGTFIDGKRAVARVPTPVRRVIRIGDSILVPTLDVQGFERAVVRIIDGFVRGPAMQAVLADVALAAQSSTTLHVRGETGTGKEGIAQAFHRLRTGAACPLVAVNCAAIPHAIAERLLFGAKRGAYSGAESDATGYLLEANGGTLFLDEIAELDLQVQAKLLRVLESRELLPLGASKVRRVEFALCSATSKDLRALVADGSLREDLYFRIGQPAVTLPPLRDRPEEIPALIVQELGKLSQPPAVHTSLIEECLLRVWPGNVRELLSGIRAAARAAARDGARVNARHLVSTIGTVFGSASLDARPEPPEPSDEPSPGEPRKRAPRMDPAWHKRIEDALRASDGNVTAAARSLGLHRTQLRRLVRRHRIAVELADIDRDDGT